MNKLLVNTPQNVQIEYNIAGIGNRLIAYIIDLIIRIVYLFFTFEIIDNLDIDDDWLNLAVFGVFSLPFLLYSVVLETLFNGQTIGKWLTKIRVVQIDGQSASFFNYFTRWIIGLVEISFSFGIIAFVSVLINKKNQRIGDMAANTVHINLKSQLDLHQTIFKDLKEEYIITFPEVSKLSDRDINIVNENFQRALKTDNFELLQALARKLEEIMDVKSDGLGFIDFIKIVIQDHYHFHRNK